jgi:hypothetical protein
VGIDPSGRRLALSVVRFGVGRTSVLVPPVVLDLRAERDQTWLAKAESVLLDFVARYGLSGSEARLAIPADKVFMARISLPPLRAKDLRAAIALELDRLFPFPASSLSFNWILSGESAGGKNAQQIVMAAPSEYIERWEELVSRTGLRLAGAVPSGWALSAACRHVDDSLGKAGETCAILRDLEKAVECTVMISGEPFYSSLRLCPPESAPAAGLALLNEALVDCPSGKEGADISVIAPSGWWTKGWISGEGTEFIRKVDGFESRAARIMSAAAGSTDAVPVWEVLGAFGAASSERGPDLLAPEEKMTGATNVSRTVTGALAAAALLLALSWPAAILFRTNEEVRRLDAEISSLRPDVERVESSLAQLGGIEGRVHILREASAGREEPLRILRQMTDRLPQGTWLTGIRLEDRKVEIDGLSPSASEIFPLLSREGQFRKMEFASPITRQPDNLERFQIRAEFVPNPASMTGDGGGTR